VPQGTSLLLDPVFRQEVKGRFLAKNGPKQRPKTDFGPGVADLGNWDLGLGLKFWSNLMTKIGQNLIIFDQILIKI